MTVPSATFLPVIEGKAEWTQFASHEGLGAFKMDVTPSARAYVTIIVNPGKWRPASDRRFDAAHPALAPKAGRRRARRRAWLYRCSPGPAYRFPRVEVGPTVGMLALPWRNADSDVVEGIVSETLYPGEGSGWGQFA